MRTAGVGQPKQSISQFTAACKTAEPAWTAEMEASLGTLSDDQLAKEWQTSRHHVRQKRLSLQIPSFDAQRLAAKYNEPAYLAHQP